MVDDQDLWDADTFAITLSHWYTAWQRDMAVRLITTNFSFSVRTLLKDGQRLGLEALFWLPIDQHKGVPPKP